MQIRSLPTSVITLKKMSAWWNIKMIGTDSFIPFEKCQLAIWMMIDHPPHGPFLSSLPHSSVLFPFIGIRNHSHHQSNRICPNLSCLLLPFVSFLPVRFNLIHSHLHLTSKGLRCWFPPCIIGLTRVFTRLICTLSSPFPSLSTTVPGMCAKRGDRSN